MRLRTHVIWAVSCGVFLGGLLLSSSVFADSTYQRQRPVQPDVDPLVAAPGVSNSVAAGVLNPAAWPIQQRGGLYLGWNKYELQSSQDDFRGVLSFGNIGFGMRRQSFGGDDHYDYTTGFGWGNRSHTGGFSWSWTKGGQATFGSSERLSLGSIHRWRPVSLGLVRTWERKRGDSFYQGDIGIRPFGSRVTFFADAVKHDSVDWEDLSYGLGGEVHIHEGLSAALRWQDDDNISFRIELGLPGLRPSFRQHADEDDVRARTYAVELRPGPSLGNVLGQGKAFPQMNLKGPVAYRTYRFFDGRQRFVDLLRQVDEAANDSRVGGIVLQTSGMRMSAAGLWEFRAQLEGLRAKGKKVIVYFDRMSLFSYAMASVADQVWMDPSGSLDLRGVNFGKTYYRRLFEKLGVGIDEWRFFTYKSAAESISRTSMSDADREQLEALLESFYNEVVGQITASREIGRREFDDIVDNKGVLFAEEALNLGFIDAIGSIEDAQEAAPEALRRTSGGVPSDAVTQLGTIFGDPVWRSEEWGEPTRVGLLYAIGPCAMDSGIEGRRLSKHIAAMRKDPKIRAIVLRVDSPGGDPLPSDLVAREILKASEVKPVIISQGQVAASGGYWISMYGDHILVSPLTITGSIGVINVHVWNDSLGQKVGMDYDHVQRGKSADMTAGPALPLAGVAIPDRPLTADERTRAEFLTRELYRDFVEQVAAGRQMDERRVDEVGQGRVWSGRDGVGNDLADDIGGLWRAIELAKKQAGIPEDREIQLVEGPDLGAFNSSQFLPNVPGLSFVIPESSALESGLSKLMSYVARRDENGADLRGDVPLEVGATSSTTWSRSPWLSGWQVATGQHPWTKWGVAQGLGWSESLYVGAVLARIGQPMLLTAPFGADGITEIR